MKLADLLMFAPDAASAGRVEARFRSSYPQLRWPSRNPDMSRLDVIHSGENEERGRPATMRSGDRYPRLDPADIAWATSPN
jgi:hypothetical protein